MDDRLKESISALMDDEANELELQRVLSHVDPDELRDTWQRYHHVRDLMREEATSLHHSAEQQIDIRAGVAEMIAREETQGSTDEAPVTALNDTLDSRSRRGRLAGLLTVAASALFALVFVWQNVSSENAALELPLAQQSQPDSAAQLDVAQRQPKIIEQFSEAHAKRFNEYLLRHAEQTVGGIAPAGLPLARVASVNSVGI